ncbi:threonine/serine exporter family protein, partial [Campylobacter jejuni]|nr:threonine/serine exporter family protein [Campylobacter jejuni]
KAKSEFLVQFFDYFFTTVSVTLALAIGVSVTLLIFFEQSFMMTRHAKKH